MKKENSDNGKVEYSIEIPKQNKYFFMVRKFMEDILETEKIEPKERDQIVLAVNEACDKLLSLAEGSDKSSKLGLKIQIAPKKITIALNYKGVIVKPNYFKKVNEEEIILEAVKNRIGEYLMEKEMDEVTCTSSKKKGHVMKLIKYRR
ncbi:MAG TPA: hypothetical protein ENN55_05130 [Firmicutes bacterium]|nr:hypothetical protein [Bacillota bacterium]